MTPAALVRKEIRALLPAFAAIVASLLFASGAPDFLRVRLVLLGLVFGTITLGGLAFGHEYTYRTLTLLLAQPIDRRRTCAAKLIALVSMVALVCLAAVLCAPGRLQMFSTARGDARAILFLAPLCAIGLAPALSMLCRSALAGSVFTVAIPALLLLVGNIIATAWYGLYRQDAINLFMSTFVWWSVPIACAAGAIGTWALFLRLEAIEGYAELQWPRWLRDDSRQLPLARKVPGAVAALVGKELRLQQLSFVVVGLFVLASAALWMLTRVSPDFWHVPIEPMTVLYGALLLILIGSVASAEERQLGTLPSQLLLPMAARTQWGVKIATTGALAFLLAIVIPVLVSYVFSLSEEHGHWRFRRVAETLAAAALLTSCSVYVSSLSSSGVRAMVNGIPVAVGGTVFIGTIMAIVYSVGYRLMAGPYGQNQGTRLISAFETRSIDIYTWSAVLLSAVFLWFAFANHRSTEWQVRRVALQVLALTITAVCCLALPLFLLTQVPSP